MHRRFLLITIFFTFVFSAATLSAQAWEVPWKKKEPGSKTISSQDINSQTRQPADSQTHKNEGYEDLVLKNLSLRGELDAIKSEYQKAEEEKVRVLRYLQTIQSERDKLKESLRVLTEQLSKQYPQLDKGVGELKRKAAELDTLKKKLENELLKARRKMSDIGEVIVNEVARKVTDLKKKRIDIIKRVEEEKIKIDSSRRKALKQLSDVEQRLEKEKKRAAQFEGNSKKASKDVLVLKDQVKVWRKEVNKLLKEAGDSERKIEKIEKERRTDIKKFEDSGLKYKNMLHKKDGEIQGLKTERKTLQQEVRAERDSYKDKLKKTEKERNDLKDEIKKTREMQKKAAIEIETFKEKKEKLKAAIRENEALFLKEKRDMHYNLAVVFGKNRMYRDAEREYLKCIEIDPDDAAAHYNLAVIYDDGIKKNKKAIKYYTKYLALRPGAENEWKVRQWILYAEQDARLKEEGMERK